MSSRSRRSVNQLTSYKEFDKYGHAASEDNQNTQQEQTSSEDEDTVSFNHRTKNGATATSTQIAEHDELVKVDTHPGSQHTANHPANKETSNTAIITEESDNSEGNNSELDIHVDPNNDDLDADTGKPGTLKKKNKEKKTPYYRSVSCSPRKVNKTPQNAKARKLFQTTFEIRPPPLANDILFTTEQQKAKEEKQAARELLLHHQREAEVAKLRLEAEEDRCKAFVLMQQTQKDNKKANQQKQRYDKEARKNVSKSKVNNTKKTQVQIEIEQDNEKETQEITNNDEIISNSITQKKSQIKNLNPLRRAKTDPPRPDSTNNPNIPGMDNGLNAWLDVQINRTDSLDLDMENQAKYAKLNSDNDRFFDIDAIPMKGPMRIPSVPSDISYEEAEKTARKLMNDDNVSICRQTGIVKIREDRRDNSNGRKTVRRAPTATVTKAMETAEWRENRNTGKRRSVKKKNKRESSDEEEQNKYPIAQGWDTQSDEDEEEMSKFKHDKRYDEEYEHEYGYEPVQYEKSNFRYKQPAETLSVTYKQQRRLEGNEPRYRQQRPEVREKHSYYQPQHRMPRTERGRKNRYSDSSSSDSFSPKRGRKIKSGISAKPTSNVRYQLKYPHYSLGQTSGFIGQNLQFHQLNYEQFLAGELATINSVDDYDEKEGRIELLQRITQWKLRANVNWVQIRNTYVHILRKVENNEITWFCGLGSI